MLAKHRLGPRLTEEVVAIVALRVLSPSHHGHLLLSFFLIATRWHKEAMRLPHLYCHLVGVRCRCGGEDKGPTSCLPPPPHLF